MPEPVVTYTWLIERLDATPAEGVLSNVVHKIHWRLLATDGAKTVDTYGDVRLSAADPENFTPYGELTEGDVIGWLEAAIDASAGEGEPTVAQMSAYLADVLAAKALPVPVPVALPWAAQ
jgi:hypothetical protein